MFEKIKSFFIIMLTEPSFWATVILVAVVVLTAL